jgi:hypothetical protein
MIGRRMGANLCTDTVAGVNKGVVMPIAVYCEGRDPRTATASAPAGDDSAATK